MKRRGRGGGGRSGVKVFSLVLAFFGLFVFMMLAVMAQTHVAATQDENTSPENFESYNQSAEFIQPFQLGWTGMMVVAVVLATLVAVVFVIRRFV